MIPRSHWPISRFWREVRNRGCWGKGLRASIAGVCLVCAAIPALRAQSGEQVAVDVEAEYASAWKAFNESRWSEAAASFERVLGKLPAESSKSPQAATMRYMLGAAYFNQQDFAKAAEVFAAYLVDFPTSDRANAVRLSRGLALLQAERYEEALKVFQELESNPAMQADALEGQARALEKLGRGDDLIRILKRMVPDKISTPAQATAALRLIDVYSTNGQESKAADLVRQLAANPKLVTNMVAFNGTVAKFADQLVAKKMYDEALAAYGAVRTKQEIVDLQNKGIADMDAQIKRNLQAISGNASLQLPLMQANDAIRRQLAAAKKLLAEYEKLPDYTAAMWLRQAKAWSEWNRQWESNVVLDRLLSTYAKAPERETAQFLEVLNYAALNQPQLTQEQCERYLKEFPNGANAATVGYLSGAVALRAGDTKGAESYFGRMLTEQPDNKYRDTMRYLLGNAKFNSGDYAGAVEEYRRYLADFPEGQNRAEVEYRIALASLFQQKYDDAEKLLEAWLEKHPSEDLAPDCRYRLLFCEMGRQNYKAVIDGVQKWREDYPDSAMEGEVLSLLGDCYAAMGEPEKALDAYDRSYPVASTDQAVNYSLFEAAKLRQRFGQWPQIATMFEQFVKAHPSSPSAIEAMSWIGKAYAKQGQPDEAKKFLVEQLHNYIAEPQRETVELLLQQLVQLCAKKPRVAYGAKPPPYDAMAELDKQLEPLKSLASPTAKARLLYAQALLAGALRQPEEQAKLLRRIAEDFQPGDLSPQLLAEAGDSLMAAGNTARATQFYDELRQFYPRSPYRDAAYVGLGEIAFAQKDHPHALELFSEAADKIGGGKIKEATLGKARALVELGRYDEASKLFQMIAGMREWRGETTASAVYALGDIAARQGRWAEAIAFYQRVFVLYQRYLSWVAKAYIGAAESFDKLGRRPEAIAHLQEMLRNEKLSEYPETAKARELLKTWGAS